MKIFWRTFFEHRRPVSFWRHILGVVVLICAAVGFFTYRAVTDESRLRRYAERWLEDLTGGEVTIDEVRLDLFQGLHLVGVRLTEPWSTSASEDEAHRCPKPALEAATVFLRLQPLSLLSDKLVVPEVVAVRPKLTLAYQADVGRWNWSTILAARPSRLEGPDHLPVVRLREVEILPARYDERGWTFGQTRQFRIEGYRPQDRPEIYALDIVRLIAQRSGDASETSHVEINTRTRVVSGNLPSLGLGELTLGVPSEAARWLERIGLRGGLRADAFTYETGTQRTARLSLSDVALSFPLNAEEENLPAQARYLWMDHVAGTVEIEASRATVELAGRFRDSVARLKGTFEMPSTTAGQTVPAGFDLHFEVDGLELPRADANSTPAERRLVETVPWVKKFIEDFDGIGKVGVALHIQRAALPEAPVRLAGATMSFQGTSARYIRFPYRLNNLTGDVIFNSEGRVRLANLVGHHGRGTATINGTLGGEASHGGDLRVIGQDIELDENLLDCLDAQDQELIAQFNPTIRADVSVHMRRPETPIEEEPPPWDSEIDIAFTDGSLNMVAFPYPLDGLTGRMRIAKGILEASELCARRGQARVCAKGRATEQGDGGLAFDVRITATAVPLDEALSQALPGTGRELYEQLQPRGKADIAGRLACDGPGQPLACDLNATLVDASLAVPGGQMRVTETVGQLRIGPDKVSLLGLTGRLGETVVAADGVIPLEPAKGELSLHLHTDRIELNNELRNLLPASGQETWDRFRPGGAAAVDVRYRRSADSKTTTQPAAEDYALTFEPLGGSAVWETFPLPLTGIRGCISVTPQTVTLKDLVGRYGDSTFDLSGRVELGSEATAMSVTGGVENLAFTEEIRQALPWRIRRLWSDLKPSGRLDLRLDQFSAKLCDGQFVDWNCAGKATARKLSFATGTKISDIDGTLELEAQQGSPAGLHGKLALSRLLIDGRPASEVRAVFDRPANDPSLRIEDIVGRFCGGTLVGRIELKSAPAEPGYGISLSVRDVRLEEFLNTGRAPSSPPVTLKGLVEGNLVVAGRFDDPASRYGGGTVLIHDAQMLKVPFMLTLLRVIHLALDDDTAFHDARLAFGIDGEELILSEIDLRGKAFSMVGAGAVHTPTQTMDLTLLVGSPIELPRLEVLSDLMNGVAREVAEVHVEGTVDQPTFRTEIVRSLKKTLETILNARRKRVDGP